MRPLLFVIAIYPVLCQARVQISNDRPSCSNVHQMKVKDLRLHLARRNVDCSGCVEKSEYVSKVLEICHAPEARSPSEQPREARQPLGWPLDCALLAAMLGITLVCLWLFSKRIMFRKTRSASSSVQTYNCATASSEPDELEATCRICMGGESDASDVLFQPCRCSGTMQYVHKSCLNQWRLGGNSARSYYECPQCHYQYNLKRLPLADFVASPLTSQCLAILLLILCIWPFTYAAEFLLGHLFYTKFVWFQSVLSGCAILGLLVHVFLWCSLVGCQTALQINLWVPLSSLWQAFWSSSEVVSPGTVVGTLAHLIVILARQGLIEAGLLLYKCIWTVAQALLQKMGSVILGQVLEFHDSSGHACPKAIISIQDRIEENESDSSDEE